MCSFACQVGPAPNLKSPSPEVTKVLRQTLQVQINQMLQCYVEERVGEEYSAGRSRP